MVMWVMSDRAIPRSYRMMEGFGVNSYRFVNAEGTRHLVKFHWKPLLGVHSLAWNESLRLGGYDPDFHRRDLWDAIESGAFPEWEFGVQLIPEEDQLKYEFDPLDPTKIVPEEVDPGPADRQADAEPQPGQLLRRDRAGGVRRREPGAGHRLLERSAAPGSGLLVRGHPVDPPGRPELPRAPDQSLGRAGPQQPARRLHAPHDQHRADQLPAQLAGRRLPVPGREDAGGVPRATPSGSTARRSASAARASATTSARRPCSGTASPTPRRSTSSWRSVRAGQGR